MSKRVVSKMIKSLSHTMEPMLALTFDKMQRTNILKNNAAKAKKKSKDNKKETFSR